MSNVPQEPHGPQTKYVALVMEKEKGEQPYVYQAFGLFNSVEDANDYGIVESQDLARREPNVKCERYIDVVRVDRPNWYWFKKVERQRNEKKSVKPFYSHEKPIPKQQ